jgi:hypothetical protein
VAVELVMQVSRADDNRLSGTVSARPGIGDRNFSGMLELMRVFEELVPVDPDGDAHLATPAEHDPPPTA